MLKQVCRSGPEEMRCPITIFDLYSKKHYMLSKCIYRRHSLRSGKKTSVIFAGHSLSGNRAMRSFLHALHAKKTRWKYATKNIPKPSLCSSSGSWFGLLHIISEELATATFMETNQKNCAVPTVFLNEAQTLTPAVQAQKSKALTFCSHH